MILLKDDKLQLNNLVDKSKDKNPKSFEELFLAFYPLIKNAAKSFHIIGFDEDDAFQEASIAFVMAVNTFSGEGSFIAYAKACIKNRFHDIYRRESSNKNRILNEYVPIESYPRATKYFGNELNDFTEDIIKKMSYKKVFEEFLAILSPFETKVFLHLLGGKNYIDVALLLGKSPKSVDNATTRLKRKLRSFLHERGNSDL